MRHYKMRDDDIKNLLDFMYEAHLNTYAADRSISQEYQLNPPRNPGHIEYLYEKGPWIYHDSYIGETKAPGREIIYFNNEPVWSMSYQNKLDTEDNELIFKINEFLKEALKNCSITSPFRGPESYRKDEFSYTFTNNNDIDNFIGEEDIYYNGVLVYTGKIIGAVIRA